MAGKQRRIFYKTCASEDLLLQRTGILRYIGNSTPEPEENSRELHIQRKQEWKEFTIKLYDAVQQTTNESHTSFTELSETEKVFVLEKAVKVLQGGDSYHKLTHQISSCLEDNIYSYVAHELQDSDIPKNQSELAARHIQDGVMNLLDKRPSLKVKLHILFNQPLPLSLRTLTWRLQLSNTKARMEYLTHVSMNKARSVLDRDISLQCQALLSEEKTFQHLRDNNMAARAMRNVLSYYHKIRQVRGNLSEPHYFLLVPLVQATMDNTTSVTSLDSISTQLVEEYTTFMDSRSFVMLNSTEVTVSDEGIFQEMALRLNKTDQNLSLIIQNIYTPLAKSPEAALRIGIYKILQPILQVLFVGYLNMSTLLYIWDQYILGLDQPAYDCLPAISLTFLILLQGHLNSCSSHSEIETVLKIQGPTLSVSEFQAVISKHFYSELFNILNKNESSDFPVLDPTQVPQWRHISKATVPPRTRPQDRRRAREEREMLMRQNAERHQEEEQMRRLKEEEQKKKEKEKLNRFMEDTKRKYEADNTLLGNQLAQEQQLSYEMQKKAEMQISELQGEIRRLMEKRRASAGGYSVLSLVAPPPSAESQSPAAVQQSDPQSPPQKAISNTVLGDVNGKTANTVILDLFKRMMDSADLIVNGESIAERDTLNVITRKHLQNHKEDVKNSEIEILGYELKGNKLERIEEADQAVKKKLSLAIKKRAEDRYISEMKAGGNELQLSGSGTYTNNI